MSKPTDLVRFAVNGSDVDAVNISAPSSGTRDTGFLTNAILTSANLDYFFNRYYRWIQYLNAGAFSGASSFDSTLSVAGLLTSSGGVTVPTGQTVNLAGTSTLTVGGLITASSGVTAAVNQSFTVTGNGNFKHSVRTVSRPLTLNSPSEIQAGSLSHTAGSAGISLANNTIVFFALPELPQHARYVNVRVYFNSATDRGNCTCQLFQTSAADPATTTFTSLGIAPSNSGTAITLLPNANFQPTGSQTLWVNISNSASTPKIQALVVDFDVP